MNGPVLLITVLILMAASAAYGSGQSLPEPNWNREAAVAASGASAVRETLRPLYELARAGRGGDLLSQARAIAGSSSRPAPQRDRILHELAMGLGELDPGLVGPEVLQFLSETRSLTLVPHDDNPAMGVPLYNIRAAASGSLARWEQAARNPGPGIGRESYSDAGSFFAALSYLDGAARTQFIREARAELDYAQIETIVETAHVRQDPVTASLLLAELSPTVIDSPVVHERLFSLLGDRDLGAPAALALAHSGDESVLKRLADLAASGESLAARRASMAIDLFLAAEDER